MSKPNLLLALHISPSIAPAYSSALGGSWTVRTLVLNGLSSVYGALASQVRDLDGLLRRMGIGPREQWGRVAIVSWSAGYKLAWALLPDVDAWIGLDSGYSARDADGTASDVQLAPVVAFAKRALRGKAVLWFGFTDIATPYASTGDVAAELVRLAGEPAQSFLVHRWAHNSIALSGLRGDEVRKFWEAEHIRAVREYGPDFVASALEQFTEGGANVEPAAPTPRNVGGHALAADPVLRRGAKGEAVRELQRLLNIRRPLPLTIDGLFGMQTDMAVVAFQRDHHLDMDGTVGPRTWAALRAGAQPVEPAPTDRRAAILALARTQLGVRETSPNDGPEIRRYLAPCVRGGKLLRLGPSEWCAAFASWVAFSVAWTASGAVERRALMWKAEDFLPGTDTPIGYRAAVSELCDDARATGRLHLAGDGYTPEAGDLAIFGRVAGESPLKGGRGHVALFVAPYVPSLGATILVLGGNTGNAVAIEKRDRSDVLAWIDMS